MGGQPPLCDGDPIDIRGRIVHIERDHPDWGTTVKVRFADPFGGGSYRTFDVTIRIDDVVFPPALTSRLTL